MHKIRFNLGLGMPEHFLVGELLFIDLKTPKISVFETNFQVFSFGEHFSISKYLEAYPT